MTRRLARIAVSLSLALVASCGGPREGGRTSELERLASKDPAGLESFEERVERYYRGLQSELRRLLEADAGDAELAAATGRIGHWYQAHLYYQEAAAAYGLAEALSPSDAAWPYRRGHAERSLGDAAAATAAWERAVELEPGYLPARIYLAELALAEGDLQGASARLQEAAESGGERHPRVLVGRGEVALQQGDHDRALELFTAAVEARPESRRARYGLGLAYRGLGQMRLAQRHLQAAGGSERDPHLGLEDPWLAEVAKSDTGTSKLWRQGRAALAEGRPESAVRAFEEALAAAPDRVDYRVDLGTALAQAGRTGEAMDAYRQALDLDSRHDGARIGLANLLTREGRTADAEAEIRTVIEQYPRHPAAHLELAHLLRRQQDLDGAAGHYETAVEIDPRNEAARFWRAWTLHLNGETPAALEALEGDLALLSGRPMLLSLKARLGSRTGAAPAEVTAARDVAERLFAARANAFHAETLAMTLAASGSWQSAVDRQQEALAAARAAGLADTSAMAARLADYRAGRRARSLLAPADMDAAGVRLGR